MFLLVVSRFPCAAQIRGVYMRAMPPVRRPVQGDTPRSRRCQKLVDMA